MINIHYNLRKISKQRAVKIAMNNTYLEEIPLESITPDPDQPRALPSLSELGEGIAAGNHRAQEIWNNLLELATSILEVGLDHPIIVYPADEKDKYVIYDGHRRWMAMSILHQRGEGNGKILCLVRTEPKSDEDALLGQINTNIQREDLNVFELARNLTKLYETLKAQGGRIRFVREDGSIGVEEVAPNASDEIVWETIERKVGIGRSRRYQIQAVLKLPTHIQRIAEEAGLPESRLRYLIPIKEEAFLEELVYEIVEHNLSNAAIKARIDELLLATENSPAPQMPKPRRIKSAIRHIQELAEEVAAIQDVKLAVLSKDSRTVDSYRQVIPELKTAIKVIETVLAEFAFLE